MSSPQPEILEEGWYLYRNDRRHGPHGRRIIAELVRRGTLAPSDQVWLPGPNIWMSVSDVTDILGPVATGARSNRPDMPGILPGTAQRQSRKPGEDIWPTSPTRTADGSANSEPQHRSSQKPHASPQAGTIPSLDAVRPGMERKREERQGMDEAPVNSAVSDTDAAEAVRQPETITRAAASATELSVATKARTDEDYSNSHRNRGLLEWAVIPSAIPHVYDKNQYPNAYDALRTLALPERWSLGKGKSDKRWPLLQRYLAHTFERIRREPVAKIYYTRKGSTRWAVFNTGLVNKAYDPICMLFSENPHFLRSDSYPPWRLVHICVPSQVTEGKRLDDLFKEIPAAAQYLRDASELIIPPGEEIKFDVKHVIFDAIEDDRYPAQFLEQFAPHDLKWEDYTEFDNHEDKLAFLKRYSDRLSNGAANAGRYRAIINRVRDAISVASKRTFWNYKTAIPSYYPKFDELSLLLPLCLDDRDENAATVALVVSRRESGVYRAWTVYPLEWAYERARVVCRPDSDWLVPDRIETLRADTAE